MAGLVHEDWRLSAACRLHDPELWFSGEPEDVEAALNVCGSCVVRAPCYASAVRAGEREGVWGGVSFEVRGRRVSKGRSGSVS